MMLYPYDNAASRARCYEYRAFLLESGAASSVKFFPPSSARLFRLFHKRLRFIRPVSVLVTTFYWIALVAPVRLIQIVRASSSDVIVVQRGLFHVYAYPVFEVLLHLIAQRLRRRTVLFDYDDALHAVAGLENYYALRCRLADRVIVSNKELANFASRYNSHVEVLETPVDITLYKPARPRAAAVPRIGWVGSSFADLTLLEPAMTEVCRRTSAVFRIVGPRRYAAPEGVRCESEPWRLETQVAQMEGFDIGIAPMRDSPYDRSRDAYKTKQYMALGIPVVVSPVGKNLDVVVDGVNGFFARGPQEWVDRLVQLVEDPRLRAALGQQGRRLAEERYSTAAAAQHLIRILTMSKAPAPSQT